MNTSRRAAQFLVGLMMVVAIDLSFSSVCKAASFEENIKTIRAVGKEGKGHLAAIEAVGQLSAGSSTTLIPVLKAFDDANPLATNWLRAVFEAIADRESKANQLPTQSLETFVRDSDRNPEARRLAYEWLIKIDAAATERLIPGMLHDASPEFRRDAVQRLIMQATAAVEAKDSTSAIRLFGESLSGAVDNDQVKTIVKQLKEMGQTVDLPRHFGFLTEWSLAGPFDNAGLKGFDIAYPPEMGVDLQAKYQGKLGEVAWERFSTDDEYGVFDLAKKTKPHKGAVTYAYATFESRKPRSVEFRLGTPNAWKLWVNGELVFGRDEYHRGTQLDQYRVKAKLRAGMNSILFKICQNEQTEEWAQDWKYQIRVCDSTGAAILPEAIATTSRAE